MNTSETQDNNSLTLEEKLAQVAAALQGNNLQPATETVSSSDNFVCPIDPAERAKCDACQ